MAFSHWDQDGRPVFNETQVLARNPPKVLLFASKISPQTGKYTLSKAEIDAAIKKYGTNIAVMVDVGGRVKPHQAAHDMLKYLNDKKIQHIGVYTEGPTGPTNGKYNGEEMGRRRELAPKYGFSDAQWMAGGWEKHFFDQVREYSKTYNATFFEADNITGQNIRFLKSFQAAKNRKELPANAQFLLKNPQTGEHKGIVAALKDGSVKRESIAHFAISEEFDRRNWSQLERQLAEIGVQLATSDDTNRYAAKQNFGSGPLAALGKFFSDVGKGIGEVARDFERGIKRLFGVKETPQRTAAPASPPKQQGVGWLKQTQEQPRPEYKAAANDPKYNGGQAPSTQRPWWARTNTQGAASLATPPETTKTVQAAVAQPKPQGVSPWGTSATQTQKSQTPSWYKKAPEPEPQTKKDEARPAA